MGGARLLLHLLVLCFFGGFPEATSLLEAVRPPAGQTEEKAASALETGASISTMGAGVFSGDASFILSQRHIFRVSSSV